MGFISFIHTFFIISLISFSSFIFAQQPYAGKATTKCDNTDNSTSVLGYTCNGIQTSCKSYLIFRSKSPHNTVSSISSFLNTDPSQVSQINLVSETATFESDKEVIVPVSYSCSGGEYYQANASYVVNHEDKYLVLIRGILGPLAFNITQYEGGIPRLTYYPYSWTKSASILFIDAPVGTGFSYATSLKAFPTSDTKSAAQTYEFLRKWLVDHPKYLKVQFFIGADSFSGISAPIVVSNIVNGNKAGLIPHMNLKGYILGCPRTDATINENSLIPYSHRMGLISDELYKATKESCNQTYVDIDPDNAECFANLELYKKSIKDINRNHILEPKCTWASPNSDGESDRRSLIQEDSADFILSAPQIPNFWCHTFNYSLSYVWANDETVQSALNIRPGMIPDWKRCNKTLPYTMNAQSVLDFHRNLSTLGLQALIFNGDHDLTVPNTGTEQWIDLLNLTVVNNWRPWSVDGQTAGYTIKYTSKTEGYRLTYATIKGAGHSPQEYKRRECFEMFERFIHYYPL